MSLEPQPLGDNSQSLPTNDQPIERTQDTPLLIAQIPSTTTKTLGSENTNQSLIPQEQTSLPPIDRVEESKEQASAAPRIGFSSMLLAGLKKRHETQQNKNEPQHQRRKYQIQEDMESERSHQEIGSNENNQEEKPLDSEYIDPKNFLKNLLRSKASYNLRLEANCVDLSNKEDSEVVAHILSKDWKSKKEKEFLQKAISSLALFKKNSEMMFEESTSSALFDNLKLESFPAKSEIFNFGDFGYTYYIVLKGNVQLLIPKPDIAKQIERKREEIQNQFNAQLLKRITQKPSANSTPSADVDKRQIGQTKNTEAEQSKNEDNDLTISEYLEKHFSGWNHVKVFEAGESFGEIALLTKQRRTGTMVCLEDVLLMSLTKDAFDGILRRFHERVKQEKIEFLRSFQIFDGVPDSKLLSLLLDMKLHTHSINHIIYEENDAVNNIYFIKEGEVEISRLKSKEELPRKELTQNQILKQQIDAIDRKNDRFGQYNLKQTRDQQREATVRVRIALLSKGQCFGDLDIKCERTLRTEKAISTLEGTEIYSLHQSLLLDMLRTHKITENIVKQNQKNLEFHQSQETAILVQTKRSEKSMEKLLSKKKVEQWRPQMKLPDLQELSEEERRVFYAQFPYMKSVQEKNELNRQKYSQYLSGMTTPQSGITVLSNSKEEKNFSTFGKDSIVEEALGQTTMDETVHSSVLDVSTYQEFTSKYLNKPIRMKLAKEIQSKKGVSKQLRLVNQRRMISTEKSRFPLLNVTSGCNSIIEHSQKIMLREGKSETGSPKHFFSPYHGGSGSGSISSGASLFSSPFIRQGQTKNLGANQSRTTTPSMNSQDIHFGDQQQSGSLKGLKKKFEESKESFAGESVQLSAIQSRKQIISSDCIVEPTVARKKDYAVTRVSILQQSPFLGLSEEGGEILQNRRDDRLNMNEINSYDQSNYMFYSSPVGSVTSSSQSENQEELDDEFNQDSEISSGKVKGNGHQGASQKQTTKKNTRYYQNLIQGIFVPSLAKKRQSAFVGFGDDSRKYQNRIAFEELEPVEETIKRRSLLDLPMNNNLDDGMGAQLGVTPASQNLKSFLNNRNLLTQSTKSYSNIQMAGEMPVQSAVGVQQQQQQPLGFWIEDNSLLSKQERRRKIRYAMFQSKQLLMQKRGLFGKQLSILVGDDEVTVSGQPIDLINKSPSLQRIDSNFKGTMTTQAGNAIGSGSLGVPEKACDDEFGKKKSFENKLIPREISQWIASKKLIEIEENAGDSDFADMNGMLKGMDCLIEDKGRSPKAGQNSLPSFRQKKQDRIIPNKEEACKTVCFPVQNAQEFEESTIGNQKEREERMLSISKILKNYHVVPKVMRGNEHKIKVDVADLSCPYYSGSPLSRNAQAGGCGSQKFIDSINQTVNKGYRLVCQRREEIELSKSALRSQKKERNDIAESIKQRNHLLGDDVFASKSIVLNQSGTKSLHCDSVNEDFKRESRIRQGKNRDFIPMNKASQRSESLNQLKNRTVCQRVMVSDNSMNVKPLNSSLPQLPKIIPTINSNFYGREHQNDVRVQLLLKKRNLIA